MAEWRKPPFRSLRETGSIEPPADNRPQAADIQAGPADPLGSPAPVTDEERAQALGMRTHSQPRSNGLGDLWKGYDRRPKSRRGRIERSGTRVEAGDVQGCNIDKRNPQPDDQPQDSPVPGVSPLLTTQARNERSSGAHGKRIGWRRRCIGPAPWELRNPGCGACSVQKPESLQDCHSSSLEGPRSISSNLVEPRFPGDQTFHSAGLRHLRNEQDSVEGIRDL